VWSTGFGTTGVVSYALLYPANSSTGVATFSGAGASEPQTLTHTAGGCTWYFTEWTASSFSTSTAQETFYNALFTEQKNAAILYSSPGAETMTDRYVVLYRINRSISCN
jgi:maltose-binding protein MalE